MVIHEGRADSTVTPDAEPPAPDRPEWLPEKFKTPEDLARAYGELETRLGQQAPQTPPVDKLPTKTSDLTIGTGGDDVAPKPTLTQEDLARFAQEYASSGTLSDQSRSALDASFGKPFIDQYLAGVQASGELHVSKVHAAAGGAEEYTRMAQWASLSLPQAEQEALNRILDSMDTAAAVAAVAGLRARYQQAVGMPASQMFSGQADQMSGVVPYRTREEFQKDVQRREYRDDPAYRQKVMDRLSISEI